MPWAWSRWWESFQICSTLLSVPVSGANGCSHYDFPPVYSIVSCFFRCILRERKTIPRCCLLVDRFECTANAIGFSVRWNLREEFIFRFTLLWRLLRLFVGYCLLIRYGVLGVWFSVANRWRLFSYTRLSSSKAQLVLTEKEIRIRLDIRKSIAMNSFEVLSTYAT